MKLANVHPDKQVLRQNNNKQKEWLRPVGKARGEIRVELAALLLSKLTSRDRLTKDHRSQAQESSRIELRKGIRNTKI